jgi:hypothetical protein
MRLRLVFAGLCVLFVLTVHATPPADAAPGVLQLPWPAGVQHRINGGDTYGCGYHQGSSQYAIDFQLATGNDVSAVAGGTVSERTNVGDIRGNWLEIDHGGGYRTRYLHLHDWAAGTSVDAVISPGQLIGHAGGTGGVDPHLHFDMKLNGAAYKPEPMSWVSEFWRYGYAIPEEGGAGCGTNRVSPYWASRPPVVIVSSDYDGDGRTTGRGATGRVGRLAPSQAGSG